LIALAASSFAAVRGIEPLLPVKPRRFRSPGRSRLPARLALQGILFVLHTGIQWEFLSQQLGFGSRMTCWCGRLTGKQGPGARVRRSG
jgi:transposase